MFVKIFGELAVTYSGGFSAGSNFVGHWPWASLFSKMSNSKIALTCCSYREIPRICLQESVFVRLFPVKKDFCLHGKKKTQLDLLEIHS